MSKFKPYSRLRAALTEHGIDQLYLAKLLRRGNQYVSHRITGKAPWSQEDMYFLMDTLQVSHDQMHLYFPPAGKEDALNIKASRDAAPRRYVLIAEEDLPQSTGVPGGAKRAPVLPMTGKRVYGR